jgi:uncharacterized protein with HEPN domain
MRKDDLVYIRHISDALDRIVDYTKGMGNKEFTSSPKTQDAVIRQLEIVGEATKQLSKPFRDKNSEIPWRKLAGLRDKLIHDYMGVDILAIWKSVDRDVPELQKKIKKMIENSA